MGGIGQTGVVFVKVPVLGHEVTRTTYPSMLEHEWYGFVPIIYFLLIGLGTFK